MYAVPCHRHPDRCIHINGEPLPICARCMSIILGFLFIPILFMIQIRVAWWLGVLCQIPMLTDGFTQKWSWRESTQFLRILTGLLSGCGLSIGVVDASRWLVRLITA